MPGNFRDLKYCKITHLQWMLISFLFISQTIIYSQVRIREKLEISPKPKDSLLLNKTASASHTMRISAHWHTDVTANIQAKMIVRDIFGDNAVVASSDWVAGRPEGDITLTISNAVCYYDVEIQFKGFTNNYQSADVKTNVYWDDMLVSVYDERAISFWDYGYQFGEAGYFGTSHFWIADFRAGYEPYIQDNYCFEMPVRINDLISDGPIYYPQKDSLTITILKGDDLFWFYDLNTGERYEKTITGLPTFFMMYNLVPKGPLPIKDSVEIVLQFQIKDDIKTLSHTLYNLNNGYVYTYCNGSQRVGYKDKKEIEAYIMNDCGNVPADAVLKAEIKKGSEYGTLIDAFSGNTGDILTNLDMSNGYADVLFFANGKEPAGEDTVIIEWTTSKDNIRRDVDALIVERAPIKISLIPPEISPGDTALIKLQKWDYYSGSYSDFPEGQTYEIGIQDGCGLGYILLPDSTRNNYYKGNYSPDFTLKFVASDSLDSDSLSVDFRAGYPNGIYGLASPVRMSVTKSALSKDGSSAGIKKLDDGERQTELYKAISQEMSNDRIFNSLSEVARGTMLAKLKERIEKAPAAEKSLMIGGGDDGGYGQTCAGVSYIYPEKGSGSELIVRPTEIMLGETKYFQTKLNEDNELVIEEVKADLGAEPQCTGINEDVWGDNPVTPAASGNKCGVYWENKYPKYTFSSIPTYAGYEQNIINMGKLNSGLIRIIGRFWEKNNEEEYKAILKAKYINKNTGETKITQKVIKVIKPSNSLGKLYSKAIDVLGTPINYDDLIIELGGKYGISPQFLKGQMSIECYKKNFGGDIGRGFAPSYRYEPFNTQFLKNLEFESGKFYITSTTTDFSNVPVNHQNLNINYYRERKTVWEVIEEHSQLVNFNALTTYGNKSKTNHKMNWVKKYGQIIELQADFEKASIQEFKADNKEITQAERLKREITAYDSANARMSRYLQYEWQGIENKKAGLKHTSEKGARNMIAQTRTASSYGPFQYLYTTALTKINYSRIKAPEDLNLKEYLDDFVKAMQEKYLKTSMGENIEKGNNWPRGYEKSINLYLNARWNSDKNYPLDILNASKNYVPTK